jgi:menaquinone-specific isochorismate synthase
MEQSIQDFLNGGVVLSLGQGQILLGWGAPTQRARRDERSDRLNIFAPDYFLTTRLPWIVFEHWAVVDKVALHRLLVPWALLFTDEVSWQPPLRSEFQHDYDILQLAIQNNELEKGVPYVLERGSIHTGMSWRARTLINLLEQPETSRVYGLWGEGEGLIGATPETLFEVLPGRKLRTMALAGTQSIEEDPQDFLRDRKQVREHRVVVDDIVERLRHMGTVSLNPMRILELPRMRHLLTQVAVDLDAEADFEDLTHLLHPTPALGASPREAGWRWLQQLEVQRPRHRFGAPFGVILDETIEICLVAIRNVQWHGETLWLGAGCGVVRESRFEDEWEELRLKRESTKRMLGL